MPPTKLADAQDLIDRAWDARTDAARAKLARQALAIDPEAIDAYNILALGAKSPVEAIALLREAVAIGRRRWAAEIKRPAQHPFWLDIDTRPFMRAVHDLALLIWDAGEKEEAVGLAEFLLKLNRNDNQGLRHLALAWHGALGAHKAVERLLKRYPRDPSADYLYPRTLDAFRRGVDAGPMLEEALSANPYVPAFLLDPDRMPPESQSEYVAIGSADEAASYVQAGREAWSNVPGALDWLASQVGEDFGESPAAGQGPAESSELFEAPLTDALEELDRLLDVCPDQAGTMTLAQLDGFLAGIIVSPHDSPPAQWLPPIWGGSEEALPGDPARSARLAELVHHRKGEIAAALLKGNLAYSPVYDVDEAGECLWENWIDGFSTAMGVGGKDWDKLLGTGDEDLAAAFLGLMRYILLVRGLLPRLSEEEVGMAPVMLPYHVETIYRRQRGLPRISMGQEPVRVGPKIGRNDPCPCGSGRKYKKCCGAA